MTSTEMFKLGMRRLAAGVSLITTRHENTPYGLVATAVTSVTGDPPTLLVCVNRTASAHAPIDAAGIFCVSLLADDHGPIARNFANPAARGARFDDGDWVTLETGAPALKGALAAFDCEVIERVPASSHTIFIGAIRKIDMWRGRIEPLLYVDGMYRQLREIDERAPV